MGSTGDGYGHVLAHLASMATAESHVEAQDAAGRVTWVLASGRCSTCGGPDAAQRAEVPYVEETRTGPRFWTLLVTRHSRWGDCVIAVPDEAAARTHRAHELGFGPDEPEARQ